MTWKRTIFLKNQQTTQSSALESQSATFVTSRRIISSIPKTLLTNLLPIQYSKLLAFNIDTSNTHDTARKQPLCKIYIAPLNEKDFASMDLDRMPVSSSIQYLQTNWSPTAFEEVIIPQYFLSLDKSI